MTTLELVEMLEKQQAYQRGAWQNVVDVSRKYAQMQLMGTLTERDGRILHVNEAKPQYVKAFKEELERAIMEAYQEDTQMGATISNLVK